MELRQSFNVLAGVVAALALGFGAASPAAADGKKLVEAQCLTCHEVKGGHDFGNAGPTLVNLKERFPDRKEVTAIIFDETTRNPQTVMPPFGRNLIFTDKEIQDIVDFLYTQ